MVRGVTAAALAAQGDGQRSAAGHELLEAGVAHQAQGGGVLGQLRRAPPYSVYILSAGADEKKAETTAFGPPVGSFSPGNQA